MQRGMSLMSNSNGLWSSIFAVFGLKPRVVNLEKNIDTLKSSVRYSDTCDEIHKAIERQLKEIKTGQNNIQQEQTGIRGDISTLLERTKNL